MRINTQYLSVGAAITLFVAAYSWASADQMADEQKTAEVMSNQKYIDQIDRADRDRIAKQKALETMLAANGNEQP